jgi:hypothetical protein
MISMLHDVVMLLQQAVSPRVLLAAGALAFVLGLTAWLLAPRFGWDRTWSVVAAVLLASPLAFAILRLGLTGFTTANWPIWTSCRRNPGLSVRTGQDVLNVVMLMPFAFAATLATRRWWLAIGLAVVASLVIEIAQSLLGSGICEVGDLSRNTAGALLGVAVGWVVLRMTRGSGPGTVEAA